MEEILKLLKDFEIRNNMSIAVRLYADGSGVVEEFYHYDELIEFRNAEQFEVFLKETQYKKDANGLTISPVVIVEKKTV